MFAVIILIIVLHELISLPIVVCPFRKGNRQKNPSVHQERCNYISTYIEHWCIERSFCAETMNASLEDKFLFCVFMALTVSWVETKAANQHVLF